ncbi:hypothetical protein SDRG_12496 [Saprolegnia diclina VS20]|uniref:Apple domain-containing protein n=1 Tax=Saprolegnia diclina (strain VS20) TaxID=1156394 RepID=T0PW28_SAPDV|nr:hypothetical protein SDRG_12496 [Saprolegnia diclina VS20]EQC29724.1 hypothetical protein SDRG_12496 [Saprolegnia diclina VS20]|eukprot:XP_008616790.1 hypothetical protein SDRG_12496 [Saprolegnia diclina VS20]
MQLFKTTALVAAMAVTIAASAVSNVIPVSGSEAEQLAACRDACNKNLPCESSVVLYSVCYLKRPDEAFPGILSSLTNTSTSTPTTPTRM